MISKAELDLAESVLCSYEYYMRDKEKQGHCRSIEYKYEPEQDKTEKKQKPYYKYYKPEVYDMVEHVMRSLCKYDRRTWSTLMSKYSKVSPFYKRQTAAVMRKNQHRRYTNIEWKIELDHCLSIFWLNIKREKGFDKYFMYKN